MDVRSSARLAHPTECPVCKVDFYMVTAKEESPDDRNLFALRYAIGGDESTADACVLDVIGCLDKPRHDVVDVARVLEVAEDLRHVGFLILILVVLPHKRRVPEHEHIFAGREHVAPVGAEGVGDADGRGGAEGEAAETLSEGLGEFEVALVVGEPEPDLGDAGRPFTDLDAVELIDIDLRQVADIEINLHLVLAIPRDSGERLVFHPPHLAVGEDEEVAASARGIEEAQRAQFGLKILEALDAAGRAVGESGVEFRAEVVEEERADHFHDVALACVVRADLTARLAVHDALEEAAENGGADFCPVEMRARKQGVAQAAVERAHGQGLGEESAVDVGEGGEVFVEVGLSVGQVGVQHVP